MDPRSKAQFRGKGRDRNSSRGPGLHGEPGQKSPRYYIEMKLCVHIRTWHPGSGRGGTDQFLTWLAGEEWLQTDTNPLLILIVPEPREGEACREQALFGQL